MKRPSGKHLVYSWWPSQAGGRWCGGFWGCNNSLSERCETVELFVITVGWSSCSETEPQTQHTVQDWGDWSDSRHFSSLWSWGICLYRYQMIHSKLVCTHHIHSLILVLLVSMATVVQSLNLYRIRKRPKEIQFLLLSCSGIWAGIWNSVVYKVFQQGVLQPGFVIQNKRVRWIAVSLTTSKNLENTGRNIQAETGCLPRHGDLFVSAFLYSDIACR